MPDDPPPFDPERLYADTLRVVSDRDQWLNVGIARGWVTEPFCLSHEWVTDEDCVLGVVLLGDDRSSHP